MSNSFNKKKCLDIPSKGGLSAIEVKDLALKLGIDIKGATKAVLCDFIERKLQLQQDKQLSGNNNLTLGNQSIEKTIQPIEQTVTQRFPRKVKPLPPIPIKKVEDRSKIDNLYNELDNLIIGNSEKYMCCINQYEMEIMNKDKKVKAALEKIKKQLLDKFYKKYQDFYYEYLYLLKVDGSRRDKTLKKWIPELNKLYIILTYNTLKDIDKEVLEYIFPPNYKEFKHYQEDRNRLCAPLLNRPKDAKRDISTLLCFRSYMMQFMTRLELLSKELDKTATNTNTNNSFTEMIVNENRDLSELQKYIDGLLLCRQDYCSPNSCTKKKVKKLFSSKEICEPLPYRL